MSEETTLNRNELGELLDVKFTTYSVWQSRGLMSRATHPGGVAKQSRYVADDAFSAYCFVLAKRQTELELTDCAVITRYLDNRPGTLKILLSEDWPRPIKLTIYPTHDLTGFNLPLEKVHDRAWESFREWKALADQHRKQGTNTLNIPNSLYNYQPIISLWTHIFTSDHSVQTFGSDPLISEDLDTEIAEYYREEQSPFRAEVAVNIFRESKRLQYDNIPRPDLRPLGLDLDLKGFTLDERLMAEAWAIQYVQDAFLWNGLGSFGEGEWSPHAEVDVTEAVTRVAEVYGLTSDAISE